MSQTVVLVDYENVHKVNLDAIPADVTVRFFFGNSQKSVTRDFFKSARKLGDRFIDIDIDGQGKNALDFHIAFYLGECLAKSPAAQYIILSRDKGFDPLVRHLNLRGFTVRRADILTDAFLSPTPTVEVDANIKRTMHLLGKLEKNKRPRTRKTLLAFLVNFFQGKLPASDVEEIIRYLDANRTIRQENNRVTYHVEPESAGSD